MRRISERKLDPMAKAGLPEAKDMTVVFLDVGGDIILLCQESLLLFLHSLKTAMQEYEYE